MSEEEAMFDPDQPTSGYVRKEVGNTSITTVNLDEFKKLGVDIATAIANVNRTLIAIESAILGADMPVSDDLSVPYFVQNEPGS